ncbi:RNA polymerase-binding protein DksA [Rhodoferax sp. PAMC 29310]|uniref:RNA polymerase-binding protein DksA n=1 Tax=Rhodoferax sp. PAMC 29310 TaxID=2822760 RepID=UPI00351D9868
MKVQSGPIKGVEKVLPLATKTPTKPQSKAKLAAPVPVKRPVESAAFTKASPKVKKIKPTSDRPAAEAKATSKSSSSVKLPAKVQVKEAVKTSIVKAAKPEVAVTKAKVTHSVASGTMSKAAVSKPVAEPVASSSDQSVPVRSGRPSSRLAQLTVPSMAQSVASTAAKASFAQDPSPQPIIPPLASAIKKDPKLANNWKTKSVDQLNDAEMIAMSDDEYMNDTQMAYFRRKLSILKQEILSSAGQTTEHLREDTVVVPDPADRATIEEEHALELRTRDRERKLLKKIEQSIVRIDGGDYGYCDETGEPIGIGRLLARPTATLSLEAQQRRELKQKMFGD